MKHKSLQVQGRPPGPNEPILDTVNRKNILIITDGGTFRSEQRIYRHMFVRLEAGPKSRVSDYQSFYDSPASFEGDIMILRSSKLFRHNMERLERSLEIMRLGNPKAFVIISLLDLDLLDRFERMQERGLVDYIDTRLDGDHQLIERALQ